MVTQYSHFGFFRRTPKTLLGHYFQDRHNVLREIAFAELGEMDVETIVAGFRALPEAKQEELDAECREIHGMACRGGITALTDEARCHNDSAFVVAIASVERFHGMAMWAFLEHPPYWTGATLFLQADNVSEGLWKRCADLPRVVPHVEVAGLNRLAQAISDHFYAREGRRGSCTVDHFQRQDRRYFFVYLDDLKEAARVRPRGRTATTAPAFEIVFVYCQDEGSLDIYAPRNTASVDTLQRLFAENILRFDGLPKVPSDAPFYSLDVLADRDFVYKYPADCGIENVAVRLLRLSFRSSVKRRLTIEADVSQNSKAIYDVLELINPPPFHVTQAELAVRFARTREAPAGTRNFKISYPNWCALHHQGRDLVIRNMLAHSGIEPLR